MVYRCRLAGVMHVGAGLLGLETVISRKIQFLPIELEESKEAEVSQ